MMMSQSDPDILIGLDYLDRKYKTGLDRYCEEMLSGYLQKEKKLNVLSYANASSFKNIPLNESNISLYPLNTSRKNYIFKSLINIQSIKLKEIIKEVNPQIIHLLIPMPLQQKKIPCAVTIHDMTPFITPEAFPKYTPFLLKKTIQQLIKTGAHFITNSNNTTKDLLKFFPVDERKVHTVYLGIGNNFKPADTDQQRKSIQQKYNLPDEYFLFIGSMNKRKNLSRIIDAFKQFVFNQNTNVKLVLAGRMEWGGNEVSDYVKKSGLADQVFFPGYIDDNDLNVVISNSIALVYMSLYEGFGFPVLEAMACGTAVIASNTSSIPEITNGLAFLTDPLSENKIAEIIAFVYNNKNKRQENILKGIAWAKNFTWSRTVQETFNVYNKILG